MRRENAGEGFKRYLIKYIVLYFIVSIVYFVTYKFLQNPLLLNGKYLISVDVPMVLGYILIVGFFTLIIHRSLADRMNFPKNSNSEYYRLLRETPSMFHTTNSKGYIVNVSEYWLEVLGYSSDEVLGKYSLDFLTQESKEFFNRNAKEYISTGYCRNIPCQYRKKNGDVIDVVLSANLIRNEQGLFIGSQTSITDISKLKQVECSLYDTEEVFKKIVYTIPDIFVQTSIEGNIEYINDIGLNFFSKYTADKVIGSSILSLVAPEDIDKATYYLEQMHQEVIGPVEYNIVINQNNRFICEVNGDVLRHADGEPYGLIFIIRNITHRKKVEKELRDSEEKFRAIVETTPDMVWEITPDARFTYASPQSFEILGYSVEKLYTMSFFDLILPEQISRVAKQFSEDIASKKRIIDFEVEALHGVTGKKLYLEVTSTLIINENGDLVGLRGVTKDITKRKLNDLEIKKARDNQEMVLRAGNMGIWYANIPNDKVFIDEVWASSLGYTKEEVTGISYNELKRIFYPDDYESIRTFINSLFSHSSTNSCIEHRMRTKDGGAKWVLAIVNVIESDSEGKPIQIMGLLKDITERKTAELKIIEANATKDKLFSIIAHDLRNPLTTIIGFTELLAKNAEVYSVDKISEMAKYVHLSSSNLFSLLENLLEWANSQRGRTLFNPKEVNLEAIVNEEIDHIYYFAQKKGVTIKSFNNKFVVYADYHMLKIVIRNLITNAIKYSNQNGKVDIFSISYNDCVEINVLDNGVGMSEDIRSKLFESDIISSQRGTANEAGTGLGLMLCKEYVEKHNGTIKVESSINEGSRFTFTLPNRKTYIM